MNPMPYQPETPQQIKARFGAALQMDYRMDYCAAGIQVPPALQRKHVFDFENGVRMIVSHDIEDGQRTLHFSFGINPLRHMQTRMTKEELIAFAHEAMTTFWHRPAIKEQMTTQKALHFWCVADYE